jgi:hypothetical protein
LPKHAASNAPWTAKALPSVVILTKTTEELADPKFALSARHLSALTNLLPTTESLAILDARFHVHDHGADRPFAVLIPLDRLYEVRSAAALRLWLGLTGRRPGANVGVLTAERRKRYILALRALDARLLGITYPNIAAGLFDTAPISKRDWISHELRDQTGRLVRLGFKMMRGGYRQLLVYPYRHRI